MKRLIRNILEKEGYVKDGILYYYEEKEGNRIARKKDVSLSCISIDVTYDTTPLKSSDKCVGIAYCLPKEEINATIGDMVAAIKNKVFNGILIRLLADGLHPKGQVHIWTEGRDGLLYVYGRCLYE